MENLKKSQAVIDGCLETTKSRIEDCILTIRNQHVMLDRDLAMLYGIDTKVLNQAVKRNLERFPQHFRFQLSKDEFLELVTNCDRFINLKHSSVMPSVFTEQGVAMLSAVLRSDTAVAVSIRIMDAFIAMHKFLASNAQVFQRLEVIEYHQLELQHRQDSADKRIDEAIKRIAQKEVQPKQGIFFDGEIYDAYKFVAELIRKAKTSIILIDNYIDESVLTLLDKRKNVVSATIYTANISKQLQLDIDRHNAQYAPIDVQIYAKSHDRFLCIDSTVYHIGASIKDLGKKWFAFSILKDMHPKDLINRIKVHSKQ